jgi:hypothetical protein
LSLIINFKVKEKEKERKGKEKKRKEKKRKEKKRKEKKRKEKKRKEKKRKKNKILIDRHGRITQKDEEGWRRSGTNQELQVLHLYAFCS